MLEIESLTPVRLRPKVSGGFEVRRRTSSPAWLRIALTHADWMRRRLVGWSKRALREKQATSLWTRELLAEP